MGSEWELEDAKSRFSELFNRALTEGAQVVSRRGKEKVVVIAKDEYDRLTHPQGSLAEFMLNSPLADSESNLERVKDLHPGDEVLLRLENGEMRLIPWRQAVKMAQEIVRRYVPAGTSLVDELIEARRGEAGHEI